MADTGDPRFAAPIWEGRYEVTPSAGITLSSTTVMLTKANQCQLCGDAEGVKAGVPFATLPEECRPARELHLPVCVGGSGSEAVSLEGTVTIAGQTATGTVSVPGQTADVTLTVPEQEISGTATVSKKTAKGTASVKSSNGTGSVTLSSEAGSDRPMLVSGEFDKSGKLVSAYTMQIVNNTSPLTISGDVEVTVPAQSASASVTVPAQSAPVSATVPQATVTGQVETKDTEGTATVEIAEQKVPVTVSGNIATGGLATLTIGTDGTMSCSSGGTVYLDGFSYHICDRWY